MGPKAGGTYRNRHTGERAVVLGVEHRRYSWVVARYRGDQVEIRLDRFLGDWYAVAPATV
jgi:hypothetical protein